MLTSRLQDGDETVDAVFESVGIKRMVASLAKLEIVKKKLVDVESIFVISTKKRNKEGRVK